MKELEDRTAVNRESIRIMMRKGLLPQPERPGRTVAHYTEKHVQAVLAVRKLQTEHRLTLDEIGDMLRGEQIELRIDFNAFSHLESLLLARMGHDGELIPLKSLKAINPHVIGDARAFESIGLIDRIKSEGGLSVSRQDAKLLAIWGKMREAGFSEEANFYPEMLDHYVEAADLLAFHEAERFLARTEGRIEEETAARMLATALPLMMDMFAVLRTKFFLRNIRQDPDTGHPVVKLKSLTPPVIALRRPR